MTEDKVVGWHHRLNEREFEQAPGDSEGQGGLVCCSPWGCKKSHMTEQLNSKTYCVLGPTPGIFPTQASNPRRLLLLHW